MRETTRVLRAIGLYLALAGLPMTTLAADNFKAAQDYLASGELKSAVIELKNVLQENPDNGEARLLLGTAYQRLGDNASSEKELRRARSAGITIDRWAIPLGHAYLGQRKAQEIIDELQPQESYKPKLQADMLVLRSKALFMLRQREAAMAALDQARVLTPSNSDIDMVHAHLAVAEKKLDEARAHAEAAIAADPANGSAWVLKGELLRNQQKYDEALQAFNSAIEADAYKREAYLGLATTHIALQQLDEAEQALADLDKVSPGLLQRHYFGAVIAFQRKDLELAQSTLETILGIQPQHLQSNLLIGITYYLQGRLEMADNHLSVFVKAVPGHLQSRKLLGAVKLKQNEPARAIEVLMPMAEHAGQDAQFFSLLGTAHLKVGDHSKGTEYLEKAAAIAPDAAAIRAQLGIGQLAGGDTDQAVAQLESAVEMDPDLVQADIVLVQVHLRNKEFDKALTAAKALLDKRKNDPVPHNLMAAAHLGKEDRDSARAELEKALGVAPSFHLARINLARLDEQDGKPGQARKHFQAILSQDPKHLGALMGLAQLEARAGAQDKAVSWLEKAIEGNPKALQPGVLLTRHYVTSGKAEKALITARRLADAHPDNPLAIETLANTQLANKDYASTVASFEKLASLKPDLVAVQVRLAQIHLKQNELDAAQRKIDLALEMEADNIQALATQVGLDLKAQRVKEAEATVKKIQTAHPQSPIGFQLEGDLLSQAGEYKAAADAYSEAAGHQSSPNLALLTYQMHKKAGDTGRAISALEEGIKKHPGDARLDFALATEYQLQGKLKEAISHYEALTRQHPDNVNAMNNLAWLYFEQGDERALGLARKAADLAPKRPEVLDTLGWIELHSDDPKKGLRTIQNAVTYGPHIPSLRYHLAVALDKNGQQKAAYTELSLLLKSRKSFPEMAEAKSLMSRLESSSK
ncbi:MAG: XrtA/PEP-CTERM system TPR-repeat protein PrsT [Sedimenticola sp.]